MTMLLDLWNLNWTKCVKFFLILIDNHVHAVNIIKANCILILQRWKLQAEANDEAERLLSSQPIPVEQDLGAS